MLTLKLYVNISPKNAIKKILVWPGYMAGVENTITIKGDLKEDTSFKAPEIDILWSTSQPYGDLSVLHSFNYVFIEDFKAFYYITDRVFLENNIIRLSLKIDYLMTYRDYILDSYGRAESYENSGDIDINNNSLTARESGFNLIYKFRSSFENAGGLILLTAGPGLSSQQ